MEYYVYSVETEITISSKRKNKIVGRIYDYDTDILKNAKEGTFFQRFEPTCMDDISDDTLKLIHNRYAFDDDREKGYISWYQHDSWLGRQHIQPDDAIIVIKFIIKKKNISFSRLINLDSDVVIAYCIERGMNIFKMKGE